MGYGLITKDNVIIEESALVDGLNHLLLSISQLCVKGFVVPPSTEACFVSIKRNKKVVLIGNIKGKVYIVDFSSSNLNSVTCLFSKTSID